MTTTPDIVIYAEGKNNSYRIRYEIRSNVSKPNSDRIRLRLLKSFSLGRSYPDARTKRAATQKATLLQRIFDREFGLTSTIIEVYT